MPALLARLPAGLALAVMRAVSHQPLPAPHHRPRLVRLIRIPPDLLHQLGRDGPLERPWLTVAIATLLAASVVLALWRGRRHRRAGIRPRHLGLHHQATYAVILSMMPYGDPGAVTQTLLGGSRKLWLANSPSHYIATMTFRDPMAIFLAAGSQNPQLPEARLLARLLTKRGQLAVVKEVLGATHTWRGARAEIPYALTFASQQLTTTIKPVPPPASRASAAGAGGANPRR